MATGAWTTLTEIKKVKIAQCIPSNPVALYWLNKLGGWDMWVFGKTQTKSVETTTNDTFMKNIDDLATTDTKEQILTKTDKDVMTLGANNLDTDDVTFIQGLFRSVKVMMLMSAPGVFPPVFKSVFVEDGTFVLMDTFSEKQNIEFLINFGENYNQEV